MRKILFTIAVSLVSTIMMAFTVVTRMKVDPIATIEPSRPVALEVITPKIETPVVEIVIKDHNKFLEDIGFRESSGNYQAVNQFGYLGKYQFGRKTLNAIGLDSVSNREFLANPSIQEEAMSILLKKNRHTLRREIRKYVGDTINGIYITESGILAAAHLAGAGNVKKFFRRGYEFKDGNGTKMTSYMIMFADYDLKL